MSFHNSPEPDRRDIKGRASGSHLTPEDATANFTGVRRGKMPMDGVSRDGIPPEPRGVKPGPSGSHQENTMRNEQEPMKVTRPTPRANLGNPLK